jgi:tetratricopeptide (TPR) repeat protein
VFSGPSQRICLSAYAEEARIQVNELLAEFKDGREELAGAAGFGYMTLGEIARAEGDMEGAIENYREAARVSTPFYQAYYSWLLGQVYCEDGRTEEAIAAHERAIDKARLHGYKEGVEFYASRMKRLQEAGCPPPPEP